MVDAVPALHNGIELASVEGNSSTMVVDIGHSPAAVADVVATMFVPGEEESRVGRSVLSSLFLHLCDTLLARYELPCECCGVVGETAVSAGFIGADISVFGHTVTSLAVFGHLTSLYLDLIATIGRLEDPLGEHTVALVEEETVFVGAVKFAVGCEVAEDLIAFLEVGTFRTAQLHVEADTAEFGVCGPAVGAIVITVCLKPFAGLYLIEVVLAAIRKCLFRGCACVGGCSRCHASCQRAQTQK